MNRKILGAMLIIACVAVAGCSGASKYESQSASMAAPAAPAAAAPEMAVAGGVYDDAYGDGADYGEVKESELQNEESGGKQETKIIITANMQMATDRFDEVSTALRSITEQSGGYVQDSNMDVNSYGDGNEFRSMSITLRVPADRYTEVFAGIKALGVVQSSNESQENVTQQYYDLQARLKTKRIEEERLLELINKATKVEDILKLEELLGNVRMEIEVYESQMKNIDRLSAYSTISVRLTEVLNEKEVIVPTNLGSRMQQSFVKSLNMTISFFENAIVFLVTIIVPLFAAFVAFVIIWSLFRITRLRKK